MKYYSAMWWIVLVTLSLAFPAGAQTITDGDTIKLHGERIRLHGIDAPELKQVCKDGWRAGEASKAALQQIISRGPIECKAVDRDRYGRTVATCTAGGQDLGAELVRQGMAWPFFKYSWRYAPEYLLAWTEGEGVHAHDCQKPWEWRAQHR